MLGAMLGTRSIFPRGARCISTIKYGTATRSLHGGAGVHDTMLTCSGCGESVDGSARPRFKCPGAAAASTSAADHVLMPATALNSSDLKALAQLASTPEDALPPSPFLKYRSLLYPYRVAISNGWTDTQYCSIVSDLDAKVAAHDGVGFRRTPLHFSEKLNAFVKDESVNVAQSHKARHLFNVMTYLLVLNEKNTIGSLKERRLAVASCGNAGLAAATIAAAADWPIDVCIPDDASPAIVSKLKALRSVD